MIDKKFIGWEGPTFSVDVEKGRLKFFAKATGNTNPVYTDEEAAKAAGYPALPAPPTFMFVLDFEQPGNPFAVLDVLGVNIGKILHGEQDFQYKKMIFAGDTITISSKITDIYDKKGGALEFLVQKYEAKNQQGELVATMTRSIVVRN
jgi:acyl dehydratase